MGSKNEDATFKALINCWALTLTFFILGLCYFIPEAVRNTQWPEAQCAVSQVTFHSDRCCPACKGCYPCNKRIEDVSTCACKDERTVPCFTCDVSLSYTDAFWKLQRDTTARFPLTGIQGSQEDAQAFCDRFQPDVGSSVPCWYKEGSAYLTSNSSVIVERTYSGTALGFFITGMVLCFLTCILPAFIFCCILIKEKIQSKYNYEPTYQLRSTYDNSSTAGYNSPVGRGIPDDVKPPPAPDPAAAFRASIRPSGEAPPPASDPAAAFRASIRPSEPSAAPAADPAAAFRASIRGPDNSVEMQPMAVPPQPYMPPPATGDELPTYSYYFPPDPNAPALPTYDEVTRV